MFVIIILEVVVSLAIPFLGGWEIYKVYKGRRAA
jgi:hypothetical protein